MAKAREVRKQSSSGSNRAGQVNAMKAGRGVMIVLAFLLACETPVKYTDVSDQPGFEELVGRRYRLVEPMNISGLNLPPGYGAEIDIYYIRPMSLRTPGREWITSDTLEVGTVLLVENVLECCFGTRNVAVVVVRPYRLPVDVPVRIDLAYLVDSYVEEY